MTPFEDFRKAVSQALTRYEVVVGAPIVPDCLCHRCVFIRGIRGELAAYEKSEAKAAKKRVKK